MTTSDDLLTSLRKHRRVFVALDNTSDAQAKAREIARSINGETYLPQLPEGTKDANEWLTSGGAQAEHALTMLNHAAHWLTAEAQHAAALTGLAREDALRALFADVGALDDLRMAEFREMMAKVGIRGKTFNDLLKTGQIASAASGGDQPQVLGEDVPVLPPALGFRRDVAIVTVSITERTKGNRLSITPYLITSTRELRRIADEQILTVNGQEIALKVLPEGSEFLMRWRYSDIKRFLDGETVYPGDVTGLREAISNAAAWDDQISEGKALSDREEAVLQALEMLTRNEVEWIKAADLREQVRELLGLTSDQLGHAQWIGHILNRLQLVGRDRKRPYSGGQMYGPNRDEVLDMMRRYEVQIIVQKNGPN